ncbi:MAG: hypothetical protein JWM89_3348 [Acidimicrobiales bacterium]|nr:hypothetical protein [Acidimicrobiales bacterium]
MESPSTTGSGPGENEDQPVKTEQTRRNTGRRRLPTVAAAAVAAIVLSACLNVSASQKEDITLINQARSAAKARAVAGQQAAANKAQAWSAHMARTGVLEHTGGGTKVDPKPLTGWCAYGENVGYGPSVAAVHQAFLKSPPHKANMLGNFNAVGTGVTLKGSTVWVAEIYLRTC